jgi:catecholate siderophore receptor
VIKIFTTSRKLGGCALACVLLAGVGVDAREPAQSSRPQTAYVRTYLFDIPAGSLEAAIAAFQRVTGLAVTTPPKATIEGLASRGVSGTFTAEQALEQLVARTGLTFRLTAANTYALEVFVAPQSVEVTGHLPYRAEASTTATRTVTLLRDVPQAVTVVTQSLMADQSMQSMADVVRYMPGIGMGQGEGNRDTPIFRGNSSTADFFVDGIRDDVQYFRDLYNVDRVEALKGPNAMIFGRGGAGGVINRSTRQADWSTVREATIQGGSYDNRRATIDLGSALTEMFAARVTGMYENSGSYRKGVSLERYGINPTVGFAVRSNTVLRFGYEHFHDNRTADRGIPSSGNRPVATSASTFFGDPDASTTFATVNAFAAVVDHKFASGLVLRNRTRYAGYDKFYQNVYPSDAVNAVGLAPISAYNNATQRQNFFNQTDLNITRSTGSVKHSLIIGAEIGRQVTDNFRNTGFFTSISPATTSVMVPVAVPTISLPVTFQQNASDADNHGVAKIGAFYAQDQVIFTPQVQAVVGLRYDQFNVDFHNNRTSTDFTSNDRLVSPRLGVIYKPIEPVSIYTSYSLAYVPRAGDQLSSLSLTNEALDPEKFTNYEVGTKWDPRPDLSFAVAVYQLNRTNIVIPDPLDVTRSLLVDGQRTKGLELSLAGNISEAWSVMGGYAYQDGKITRTLSPAAPAGAVLGQLPAHSFSLWNRCNFARVWGVGLGIIHRTDMFTSTDNTVVLPGFTRVDGALFLTVNRHLRGQVNVENLLDDDYFAYANGNNNITPGSQRAIRVALTTHF